MMHVALSGVLAGLLVSSAWAVEVQAPSAAGQTPSDPQRLEALRQHAAPKPREAAAVTPQLAQPDFKDRSCLRASGVRMQGADLIPELERQSWLEAAPSQSGCVAIGDVNALLYNLSTWYMQRGYVTSQPVSSDVNEQGELVIQVMQGRIEKIVSSDPRISVKGLLSDPDAVLNLRAIEQAASQINRLDSRAIAFDIEPGEASGTSVVKLRPQTALPERDWAAQGSVDNHDTKQLRGSLSLSIDNLLGRNESVYINTSRELNQLESRSRAHFVSINVPDGYSSYSASAYASYSTAPVTEQLDVDTAWTSLSLKWDRVLSRGQTLITAISLDVTRDRATQVLGDYAVQSASWDVTHATVGLDVQHNESAYNSALKVQLDHGLNGFKDGSPYRSDYTSAGVLTTLSVPLAERVSLTALARGQYTLDNVPGFKRFSIGGVVSVPGYRRHDYSGNSGALTQIQLSWQLPGIGQSGLLGQPFGHQLSLSQTTGWIFSDAHDDTVKLSSIALQYAFAWGAVSGSLGWATPLHTSDTSAVKSDDWTASLAYRY